MGPHPIRVDMHPQPSVVGSILAKRFTHMLGSILGPFRCEERKKVIGSSNIGARTENRQKMRGLSQSAQGQEYKNLKSK